MDFYTALVKLNGLINHDLRALADEYGITVWSNEKINKGWAGQVLEMYLGLGINRRQVADGGTWELKLIPLKRGARNQLIVKETMAITMINPAQVVRTPFEHSHLYAKLRNTIICVRIFESVAETRSILYKVKTFNLDNERIFAQVRADYELVRETIKTIGFEALTGKMGVLVQPRTKGPGHGSTSRAFYARAKFLASIIGD